MTPVLRPGVTVLIDAFPWRGHRGVVAEAYAQRSSDGYDALICIGPCQRPQHDPACLALLAFTCDELIVATDFGPEVARGEAGTSGPGTTA